MSNGQRIFWLDILRIFAFFSILICHSPAHYDGMAPGRFFISAYNYYGLNGVYLFFMISGALLLGRHESYSVFLRQRLSKIVCPLIFWSIIMIMYDSYSATHEFNIHTILNKIILIPLYAQTPGFWFLYSIIGCYLIMPIVTAWLKNSNRHETEFLLWLWGVTTLFPYLELIVPDLKTSISPSQGWLFSFCSFFGYVLLGYYLNRYINKFKIWYVYALIFSMILPGILQYIFKLPHDSINDMTSWNHVLLAAFTFICVKFTSQPKSLKINTAIASISKYSFGVYLIHVPILRTINLFISPLHWNYLYQVPVTAILTGLISLLIVYLIAHLPYSKYLIG